MSSPMIKKFWESESDSIKYVISQSAVKGWLSMQMLTMLTWVRYGFKNWQWLPTKGNGRGGHLKVALIVREEFSDICHSTPALHLKQPMSRVLVTSCKPNPKVSHNHATTIRLRRLNYLDIEGAQSVKCENVLPHQSHINVAVISHALKFLMSLSSSQ